MKMEELRKSQSPFQCLVTDQDDSQSTLWPMIDHLRVMQWFWTSKPRVCLNYMAQQRSPLTENIYIVKQSEEDKDGFDGTFQDKTKNFPRNIYFTQLNKNNHLAVTLTVAKEFWLLTLMVSSRRKLFSVKLHFSTSAYSKMAHIFPCSISLKYSNKSVFPLRSMLT